MFLLELPSFLDVIYYIPNQPTRTSQSPIYLILSSSLPSFLDSIIWPLADLVSAFALAKIWDSRWREDEVRRHVGDVGGRLGDGEIRSKRWLKKWGKEWKWNAMLLLVFLLPHFPIHHKLTLTTLHMEQILAQPIHDPYMPFSLHYDIK